MIGLTEAQQEILDSLAKEILSGNVQAVKDIFKDNEDSNIQKILRLEWISNELRNTVLRVAIDSYNIQDQEKAIEIIKLIWQKADQKTRDFLCNTEYGLAGGDSVNTINMLRSLQERTNDSNNGPALEAVIQEMEEHKRVMGHINNFHMVLKSLDSNDSINWEQIEKALDFGNDQEKVFTCLAESTPNSNLLRESIFSDYEEEYEEEVVKTIEFFKLFYQKTPEKFRRSLFGLSDNNKGGFTFLFRNNLENLKSQPGLHKLVNDFIQKIDKDLNEYASKKLIEEQRIEDAEHIRKLKEQETETAGNTHPVPTTDNKIPEKNDTNFWSEHKGKIALGVTGLCVAGAIAAYVLAYPAVALALTVLAAVVLMGTGISKVLEDSKAKKHNTGQNLQAS